MAGYTLHYRNHIQQYPEDKLTSIYLFLQKHNKHLQSLRRHLTRPTACLQSLPQRLTRPAARLKNLPARLINPLARLTSLPTCLRRIPACLRSPPARLKSLPARLKSLPACLRCLPARPTSVTTSLPGAFSPSFMSGDIMLTIRQSNDLQIIIKIKANNLNQPQTVKANEP